MTPWKPAIGPLALVVAVWLIYLTVEMARHVHAWPFALTLPMPAWGTLPHP